MLLHTRSRGEMYAPLRLPRIATVLAAACSVLLPIALPSASAQAPQAKGHTYYVATSGRDTGACSRAVPCQSLSYITRKTHPGDTVLVEPGTYGPQVISARGSAQKPVTVRAVGSVTLTRPSPASYTQQTVALLRIVNSTYTIVSGFHVIGMKGRPDYKVKAQPWGGEVGLFSYGNTLYGRGVVIQHLVVEHANNTCIKTEDGEPNVTIRDNTLVDCGWDVNWLDHGIYASGPNNVIEGNHINGTTGWGIHVYGHDSPGLRIENNVVTGARYFGILTVGWKGIISGNNVYGNGGGLDIRGSKNLIADNIIANNTQGTNVIGDGTGIIFYAGRNAVVNNTFYQNRHEIHVLFSTSATKANLSIRNNIFYGSGAKGSLINSIPVGSRIDHNLYFRLQLPGGVTGHSIVADPRFVSPGKNFHLRKGSPAIGKGVTLKLGPFHGSRDLGALCYACKSQQWRALPGAASPGETATSR